MLLLWRINIGTWFVSANKALDQTNVYVVTKEGRLLYSNNPDITTVSYVNRPLVQKFIEIPFRQGQLEFSDHETKDASYGFFYGIPDTNMVIFAETSRSNALGQVRTIMIRFIFVVLIVLIVSLVLLQLPLSSVTAPMHDLLKLVTEVSRGNFILSRSS